MPSVDKLVAALPAVADGDLMLCEGVAYQADMSAGRVPYDANYLAKIDAYEGTAIAQAVNAGRCALLARHLDAGASVLDIGAGSGAFVRCARSWGFEAHGFDVILQAADRLRAAGLYAEGAQVFDALTLWDVLEHIEDPQNMFDDFRKCSRLFVSLPVFTDLTKIRESRHYRPGEHLYYWTAEGFVALMASRGFRLLEQSSHETDAGRDSIGAFAFERM
jgi:2-polyprenyl-3-methyl-5-hydroxy-6-metoxy-1,4-benzoquinol methylase